MDFGKLINFMDNMAQFHTIGNAIKVYYKSKPVFEYYKGFSDVESNKILDGNEMYNIYSCTKIATVTAGMQLIEQGKLNLTDPLYAYIPEYKNIYINNNGILTKTKNPITIEHLFTMTAGFDYNINSNEIKKAKKITNGKMDTITVAKCISEAPLLFEPGSHWNYSLCHDILGAVISIISGEKLRDYMKKNIFEPLDMTETFFHHNDDTLNKTAEQYLFKSFDDFEFDPVEAQKNYNCNDGYFVNVGKQNQYILGEEYDSAGAGIITTVNDYSKFLNALSNGGINQYGEKILDAKSINLIRTNRLNDTQLKDYNWEQLRGCGYGLGVRTHMDPTTSGLSCSIGEFGWGGAAGSSAIIDPNIGLAVFYAQHTLNPREAYYQPLLRQTIYSCL